MTTFARDLTVQTLQRKCGLRMCAQPDLLRQPQPTNAGVTVLASISELRLVHLRMTGHALRPRAGSCNVSFVVTGLALRLGVTARKAQARMIRPDVGDLAPIGFIVTGSAFLPSEGALVGVLVTGHAIGLQPEIRRVTAPVPNVMTVLTSGRRMRTLERPARLAMIETIPRAARPADESRIPSEMLDVASAAVLTAVFTPVQTRLLPNLGTQVVVTS